MELSCINVKKFLICCKKTAFLIFQEKELFYTLGTGTPSLKKSLYFSERTPRKNSLYLRKRKRLSYISRNRNRRKTSNISGGTSKA